MRAGSRFCGAMMLYCGVLRSVYAGHTFLLECFALDHACCLPHERQTGRLAECCVPIPPWVGIDIRAFSRRWRGYLPWLVHFGFVRFFMAISTGCRGRGERSYEGDGAGGAA